MQVFNKICLWADFHFGLNVNINVTVVSYMNSSSGEEKLYNFLQRIDLIIFRIMKHDSTSRAALSTKVVNEVNCKLKFLYW